MIPFRAALLGASAALAAVTGAPQLVNYTFNGYPTMPTSFTVNYPGGRQSDDIAIIHVWGIGAVSALTIGTPSGWTQIDQVQVAIGNAALAAFWKRMDGSESGSVTITASGGTGTGTCNATMSLWRGCVNSGSPIESSGHVTLTTSANVAGAPTRTIASPDRTLVHCYGYVDNTPVVTEGAEYTQGYEWTQSGTVTSLSYRQLTVPIDVAETASLSATSRSGCIYFSLIPQTTVGSSTPYANDPFWNYAKLLCGFEGSNGSTSFVDESQYAHTLTANGNAQISTAQKKFGSSSYLGDGTGDYVSSPDSDDWCFGAEPFTVESFVRITSLTGGFTAVSSFNDTPTSAQFSFRHDGTNLVFTFIDTAGTQRSATQAWTPTLNTQYHITVDRSISGNIRLYVDGAMLGSATSLSQTIRNTTEPLRIGAQNNATPRCLNGYLDELRITKGIARCGSDAGFTVPAAAYPRS